MLERTHRAGLELLASYCEACVKVVRAELARLHRLAARSRARSAGGVRGSRSCLLRTPALSSSSVSGIPAIRQRGSAWPSADSGERRLRRARAWGSSSPARLSLSLALLTRSLSSYTRTAARKPTPSTMAPALLDPAPVAAPPSAAHFKQDLSSLAKNPLERTYRGNKAGTIHMEGIPQFDDPYKKREWVKVRRAPPRPRPPAPAYR